MFPILSHCSDHVLYRPTKTSENPQYSHEDSHHGNDFGHQKTTARDSQHCRNHFPQSDTATPNTPDDDDGDDGLEYLGTFWPSGSRKPPFPPGQGKCADEVPEWMRALGGEGSRKRKASDNGPQDGAASQKKTKGIYSDMGLRIGTLFGHGHTVIATLDRADRVQFYTKPRGRRMVRRKVDFAAVDLDPKFMDAEEATIEAIVRASFDHL